MCPARPGAALGRLLPELDPGGAAEPAADGVQVSQLLELVLGLLGRLSARRPLLLVLEDLHWSDQSTRELVAFLIRSLRGVRVVLLATYRSDELNRRHPLRPLIASWDRLRTVQHVELRRFEPGEVAAQLGAILGTEPAAGLVDLVFDRSGGNAYLVEELAGLVRGGGDPADLPPSLADVLLSRVDALSPQAQRLLRTAAVAGRSVPDKLLAEVAGVGDAEFYAGLREAVESHLLVVDHTGRSYAFRHALTRDAVYEDMLPGERGGLHAAYGEALTSDPDLAGDAATVPAALAHHWYAALDLPRALPASVAAARHALTTFAPAEAQRHLERALEIWPRSPTRRSAPAWTRPRWRAWPARLPTRRAPSTARCPCSTRPWPDSRPRATPSGVRWCSTGARAPCGTPGASLRRSPPWRRRSPYCPPTR
jgi:predicted ATPase